MKQHTALITGATGGIGEAIAHRLASEGYSLLLHYHKNKEKAVQLRQSLSELYSVDIQLCQADLSTKDGPNELVSKLVPKPTVLIHNAGLAHYSLFHDVKQSDYERMIQLHITSPFVITQQLVPAFLAKSWGRIIFVTSIWAEMGAANESLYSLAKGGITSLMKSLARELGPSGITVNAVAPGIVDTPMSEVFSKEDVQELCMDIPLRRLGTPEEVAHCVAFLTDQRSGYITGQVIRVNGGWHM